MKTLKTLFLTLIAVLFCVFITSCSEEEYKSKLLDIQLNDIVLEDQSNSKTIVIPDFNFNNYYISSNASWCMVHSDGSSLVINVYSIYNISDGSPLYDDRSCIVTLKDPKDNTTRSFTVTQKKIRTIEFKKNEAQIPEKGGKVSIDVTSSVDYNVIIPSDCDWLKQTAGTRGLSMSTITFEASSNNSGDVREAIVTFKDKESEYSNNLKIIQDITPYLDLNTSEITIMNEGGDVKMTFATNSKVSVEINDDWVQDKGIVETSENNYVLNLHVDASSSNASRKSEVILSTATKSKKNVSKTIIINQVPPLNINESELELYEGEEHTIDFTNNTGSTLSWSSSDNSIASVNSKGTVTAKRTGTAVITAKSSDGKYSDEITVNVVSLSSKLTCTWSVSSISMGGWIQAAIGCTLINNSKYDIVLTKCTIYKDGKFLNSTTDSSLLGALPAGGKKGVSINNVTNFSTVTFSWEYKFNGKSLTYDCDFKNNL